VLSKEDNELLCRVGPGSPMGDLMRLYWIPALLSSELPGRDSNPVRTMLLGEQLIAFRDTNGHVGLIQNNCPHRGASLFFGRNEESGLRCVYHGWKFSTDGTCVDMPNEPAESDFRTKVKATAYPCQERGGVVWAYMGPASSTPPPLPDLEPNMLSDGEWNVSVYQRECNWMQALEGDIDTCHTVFLHTGSMTADDAPDGSWGRFALADRAPRYEVVPTDAGVMYTAYRPAETDSTYYRIAQFLFPFYAMVPTGVLGLEVRVRAWVPMDDHHTLAISMSRAGNSRGTSFNPVTVTERHPDGTGWFDRFRCVANESNDYQIDRAAQRSNESYTGIGSIYLQDQAVTESMGPVYKRWEEHLGTSDAMIIRTRRRLIDAARALRDNGTLPPGADDPGVYAMRSGGIVLPRNVNWVEATAERRKAFVQHEGLSREVLGGIPAV
jgi:phenylpropionate dioxygenase-like ring-hydroxylating dioxygenase large terminal subunit